MDKTNKQAKYVFVGVLLFIVLGVMAFDLSDGSLGTFSAPNIDTGLSAQFSPSSEITMYETVNIFFPGSEYLDQTSIQAWLADTSVKRSKGLSVIETIREDEAMLFVFEEPSNYPFWMKDMSFAIDILWLNENKEIVFVKEDARPEDYPNSYHPDTDALYVLEFRQGFVANHSLKKGDILDW